jgi:hypothetical protein
MSRPGGVGNPHRFAKQHQLDEIPFTEAAIFRYNAN